MALPSNLSRPPRQQADDPLGKHDKSVAAEVVLLSTIRDTLVDALSVFFVQKLHD